jgi:hypothetical protein
LRMPMLRSIVPSVRVATASLHSMQPIVALQPESREVLIVACHLARIHS